MQTLYTCFSSYFDPCDYFGGWPSYLVLNILLLKSFCYIYLVGQFELNWIFLPFCRYSITKALCVAFVMTFLSVFDVPVFWPILLCYWIVLFVLTMKRQIVHMIKYKYVPFNTGKQVSDLAYHPLTQHNFFAVLIICFCNMPYRTEQRTPVS